ncbi:DNA repair protein PprA [Deinococcus sp. PESE-13]
MLPLAFLICSGHNKSTMARGRAKDQTAGIYAAFDTLMSTAGVDSQMAALAASEADAGTLDAALTQSLQEAQGRWGLGLHHLRHEARLTDDGDIEILTDGRPSARVSEGFGALAQAYAPMQALDERGLSQWAALGEGYRAPGDLPLSQLKVLIEHARDFETDWAPGRGETFQRVWRRGDTLFVEVARPASAEAALSDAAWDVIASIKDRAFQRELMRRSEKDGMLGALLGARHAGAKANLAQLPEAHFTVQSFVQTLSGAAARNAEEYRAALKTAAAALEEYQGVTTRQLSEVLRHGLRES